MPKRRRTKLPETCPHCGLHPRPPHQAMCRTCSRMYRVFPSKAELVVARWVAHMFGPALNPSSRAILDVGVARLQQGKVLTADERLALGEVLLHHMWDADAENRIDPAAETLYRKLMGHDRVTMQPAPYRPLA